MKITLQLPWPPSILTPNNIRKNHWAVVRPYKNKYKEDCYLIACQERPVFPEGKIPLQITFYPPDARKRDDDGMIGAFKYGRDGIAKAWGIDDNRFEMGKPIIGEIRKYGAVEVSV